MKKLVLSLVAAVSVASAAFAAEKERVVIVPCHPDDLVAAFGFCLLARDVYDLHVVDYTRGERGCGPVNYTNGMAAAMRTAEEEAVCADLGAKLYWLDQPDGAALVTEEAVDRLSEILNELKPRAVIGHWPVDIHGDHTMAGAAMLKAVCNVSTKDYKPEVYFFDQPYQSKAMTPDVYLDITEVAARKSALKKHYFCQGAGRAMIAKGVSSMEEVAAIKAEYQRKLDEDKEPKRKGHSRMDCCDYYFGMHTSNLNIGARVEPYRAMFPRQQGQETVFDRLKPCALRMTSRFQGLKTGKWAEVR